MIRGPERPRFTFMNPGSKIRRRGAYLLPNALTTAGLFAGVYSIISGINGQYEAAAVAIGVAGILDGLDGRVARLTNTQSEFGEQYDSLADMVSFGLAPALLSFNWSLKTLGEIGPVAGKLGWLAAFVFIACAALRLARFNAQAGGEDKTYFQGLASPAAALSLAATVWFFVDRGVSGESVRVLLWFVTVIVGVLMFSRVRYFSFKTISFAERVPITGVFLVMLALVLLAVDPPAMGVIVGLSYVTSGLVLTLVGRRKRLARRRLMQRRRQARQAAAELGRERVGADRDGKKNDNGSENGQ